MDQLRALLSAAGIQAYVCSNDVRPAAERQAPARDPVIERRCRKLVVPFVDGASANDLDLAMLAGTEQVRFDPSDPLPAVTNLLERFKKDQERQMWAALLFAMAAAGLLYVATQA